MSLSSETGCGPPINPSVPCDIISPAIDVTWSDSPSALCQAESFNPVWIMREIAEPFKTSPGRDRLEVALELPFHASLSDVAIRENPEDAQKPRTGFFSRRNAVFAYIYERLLFVSISALFGQVSQNPRFMGLRSGRERTGDD